MNFYGIDYNTIFTYVQHHCPWALPYIQYILYAAPSVLFVVGWITDRLPDPGYQIEPFSDIEIAGKLSGPIFSVIDKVVTWSNQFVVLLNYLLSTRLYSWIYSFLCMISRRVKKTEQGGDSVKLPPQKELPTSLADLQSGKLNADNLTPEQIQARARLLSDELAKSSNKVLRSVTAQRAAQFDANKPAAPAPVTPEKDTPHQ